VGSYYFAGAVFSPIFKTNSDGVVTVRVSARSYIGDYSTLSVSLTDEKGNSYLTEKVSLANVFTDIVFVLKGNANANTRVRLMNTYIGKRVFLDTADIYLGDATKTNGTTTTSEKSDVMTFSGITDNFITLTGLDAGGTYYYRVKAVPADSENFVESEWSDEYQFTLSEVSGVNGIKLNDENAPVEYYNLQGVKVSDTPTPGLYIRRQGSKTTKVLIL
jgi:hypothetical protein